MKRVKPLPKVKLKSKLGSARSIGSRPTSTLADALEAKWIKDGRPRPMTQGEIQLAREYHLKFLERWAQGYVNYVRKHCDVF